MTSAQIATSTREHEFAKATAIGLVVSFALFVALGIATVLVPELVGDDASEAARTSTAAGEPPPPR